MKDNVVTVTLYGREICKLIWQGGYRKGFGKVGALVSFTMNENGCWRLAPAYDITFTVNYKNRFIGDRHAMSIGESDRRVTRDQLLSLANENDVREAGKIIDEVSELPMTFKDKAYGIIPEAYSELIFGFIKERGQI